MSFFTLGASRTNYQLSFIQAYLRALVGRNLASFVMKRSGFIAPIIRRALLFHRRIVIGNPLAMVSGVQVQVEH